VAEAELYRTFNMGIGMVAIVGAEETAALEDQLQGAGQPCFRIGEVVPGDRAVLYA